MTAAGDGVVVELLNPRQTAEVIGQCRTTVFKLIRTGELEVVRPSPRKTLVPREAAIAYKNKLIAQSRTH